MLDRVALTGMMILAAIVCFLSTLLPCQAAKLTDSQIQIIQADIQNCTNLSSTCLKNHDIADRNSTIASSNYQRTGIKEFRRAAAMYGESKAKFLETRKVFDDAWIQMQSGMVNGDLASAQKGINLRNIAAQQFNAALQEMNNAAGVFQKAYNQSQDRPVTGMHTFNGRTYPTRGGIISWAIPGPHPSAMPLNRFPLVALLILTGTFIASSRAFKDHWFLHRCILHPWSIMRHKASYRTLVTSGFIHADPMHLMTNLVSFAFFALPLEGIIGHAGFFLVYFGSLILSSIVVSIRHGNDAHYRCLGASGAISGIIFSYIIYRPTAKIGMMFAPIGVPAPVFALFFIGFSYFMSKTKFDNVAHDAHLWGAIAGVLVTVIIDPRLMGMVTSFLH